MYRLHVDPNAAPGSLSFYEKCAQELASEYSTAQGENQASLNELQQNGQTGFSGSSPMYTYLIQIVANLNWSGEKPQQISAVLRQNLEVNY